LPYLAISDFKYGMDRRRPQAVGVPGTLWTLKNGVVTRGGDVKGAKKWVDEYTLPDDTFGLYILRGQPWVFGSASTPGSLPAGVNYQQLQAPDTPDMTRVIDVKAFDGKLYVIAKYDDGNTYHFYDGTRITTWDTIAAGGGGFALVAAQLATLIEQSGAVTAVATGAEIEITAVTPGTAFTISTLAEDLDSDISNPTAAKVQDQANVAGVAGVKATATITITGGSEADGNDIEQITIDPGTAVDLLPPQVEEELATGTITITGGSSGGEINQIFVSGVGNILDDQVEWQGSASATAEELKDEINQGDKGVTATRVGTVITITAPAGTGTSWNGKTISYDKHNISTQQSSFQGGAAAEIPVPFTTDNATTAELLADVINEDYAGHGYTAEASGAVVTITAPATGTSYNSATITPTVNGDVTSSDTDFSGGVNGVTAVAQVETVTISGSPFDAEDRWSITINGTTYSVIGGSSQGIDGAIAVMKKRVFATIESLLRYCQVNDPLDWTTTTDPAEDAGFINVSTDSEGAQKLVGLGVYDGQLAIFSENNIIVYSIFVDAEENALSTTLERTGTVAARSIIAYGNNDVFFLTRNGIRSIRARAGTTTPATADVGAVIDSFVREALNDANEDTIKRAVAEIEPVDGLYMLALGDRVFVLSQYVESKITAWSYLEPGFTITDMHSDGRRLWARDTGSIYIYGGMDGTEYPDEGENETQVITPFMSAEDPAGLKMLQGFDVSLAGDWVTNILVDPNDTTKYVEVGTINEITYDSNTIKLPGRTSHMALSATCSSAGERLLSSLALHYEKEGAA
jgi:hypothetical protein